MEKSATEKIAQVHEDRKFLLDYRTKRLAP